jgi:hypothetical protein
MEERKETTVRVPFWTTIAGLVLLSDDERGEGAGIVVS